MAKKHPPVKVKVKILTTVAKSIYAETLTKIREAVANSIDNSANRFLFSLKKNKDTNAYVLSLFDNGHGITKARFEEILQSIGYGLHIDEPHPEKYYSFFGLGLMSIFQLGKKITILTRSKNSNEFNKLAVDSAKIFSKEMEKESIDALSNCFDLDTSSEQERAAVSPVTDQILKREFGGKAKHYTEIIIEDLHAEDLETIMSEDENFFENLSKMLPLSPNETDHFLSGLEKKDKNIILKLLADKNCCPTISFSYATDNAKYYPLYKYFPNFRKPPTGNQYQLHSDITTDFSYYLITCGRDLGAMGNQRETGLWFRNKNVLVRAADYLLHQGMEPLADRPIQDWMFGEFFHKDMNEFLQVSRNDFDRSKDKYKEFRNQVRAIVKKYSDHLRAAWETGKKVKEMIKEPLDDIKRNTDKSPFRKMQKSIKTIFDVDEILEDNESQQVFSILTKIHNAELEKCPEIIVALKETVVVENKEKGYILRVDPKANEDAIKYLADKEMTEVVIPANTFQSQDIDLFGKTYRVRYCNGKNIDAGISFNPEKGIISVNPFYPDLMKYSLSFLDVFIALEYAYHGADCTGNPVALECMDNMKKSALEFLGGGHADRSEYMRSLRDSL